MSELLFALLPLALLVVLLTLPRPVPSWLAFAIAATAAFGVRLWFFGSPPQLLAAAVLTGWLDALTPIAIVFGAICFFVAMERSGAMETLREWLRGISPHPVAQLMIVGWAFQFLIEGASGFGTPAALAAPLLVGLGFPALRVAALCLSLNSIPVAFGAVGTPIWFGFAPLGLEAEALGSLGLRAALLLAAAALVAPSLALRFLLPWGTIRRSLGFILLSTLACVAPMVALAPFSPEFPSVLGGLAGLAITVLIASRGIGLGAVEPPSSETRSSAFGRLAETKARPPEGGTPNAPPSSGLQSAALPPRPGPLFTRPVLLALAPLVLTVGILLATRLPALGWRQWLTSTEPQLALPLGGLGTFTASPSLVLGLEGILGEGLHWSHALLYVPSILPFLLVAALTLALYRALPRFPGVLRETGRRTLRPAVALFGALAFVQLFMAGGEEASTLILGNALAALAGEAWIHFAPLLGVLGSFFAGSATISNLTFGGIQQSIALESGLDPISVLALQSAGAAVGNMVCVHNIVAVCAVLGLANVEGRILKMTLRPLLAALVVFALVAFVM